MMTKKDLIELIKYEVIGGLDSSDSRLDDRFVLHKINDAIAYLAKKNAFESNNLDGITVADGQFEVTYTGLPVQTDAVAGLKYIETPANIVGLPRNRAFTVYPSSSFGGAASTTFKAISSREVQMLRMLPKVPNVIFFYISGGKIYFVQKGTGYMDSYTTMNLVAVSAGGNDMSEVVNLPGDMIHELKMMVVPQLRQSLFTPQDTVADGNDTKTA